MGIRFSRIGMLRAIGSLWLLLALTVIASVGHGKEKGIPSRIIYADDYAYPPFSFLDSKGKPAGFNVELIKAIGREVGVEIEVRLLPWKQVQPALEQSRSVDVSAMFYLAERDKTLDYTMPFTTAAHEIYRRRGSPPVDSLDDLNGRQLLVEARSFAAEFMQTYFPAVHLIEVDSEPEALRLLSAGTADAALASQSVGFYYIAQAGLKNIAPSDVPVLPINYSFVTLNGRNELIEEINRGMARVRRSGEYGVLYNRWFGAHPPGLAKHLPWWYPALGGALILLVTCAAFAWTWSLRKQVAERTRQLQEELTERERAERRLRESEARFHAILDHSVAVIYLKDIDGRYLLVNRAFLEVSGRSASETTGHTDWELFPPERAQFHVESDLKVLRSGMPLTYEDTGEYQRIPRTFVTVKFPIRDADGVIEAVGGVSMDITDRKRFEQQLEAARTAAERANHAKDRFLAILSHELRTPLTPVLVAVTEALSTDLPEEMRSVFEMIQRNIELEARLIEDLLDLTRLVRGKLKLHFRTSNAHELIKEAAAICAASLAGKEQEVRFELNAANPYVNADPARLQQVFWNLLHNAIKFSPKHSTIVFRSSTTGDGRLLIECMDRGIGMEREVLSRIFRPFEQVESPTSLTQGGLGLGLAISRMIVEAHRGTIMADSPGLGAGSVFSVTLPTVAVPLPGATRPGPEAEPELAEKLRILLVEDSDDTRRILAKLLKAKGHEVETADSVASAKHLWHRNKFDLLLSDIGLPDATGLELAETLRSEGPLRAIAFSGFGSEEDVRKSKDAGFAEHLVKPLDVEQLKQALSRVMSKSPVRSEQRYNVR